MNFLITGAGRGIGLELTKKALGSGATVYAMLRNPEKAKELQGLKKEMGEKLQLIKAEVTSEKDLAQAKKMLGSTPLDVVINNAGVLLVEEDFSKVTLAELTESFAVNTFAPLRVAQLFLENMLKAPAPKLVNITSQMGSVADNGSGGYYAYRMSKAALNMFNKSFSVDHPEIIALTLHPGWVKTAMGGPSATVTPEESAAGLFKVFSGATKKDSGHFKNFHGEELPW